MIDGVVIQPLKVFTDQRGKVMHMLRCDSALFEQFGEIYFSLVNAGVIKGWKKHQKITQHFAVPTGNIKLVLYDEREDSPTFRKIQEIFLGADNYQLVRIPPQVWYAFGALHNESALVANCTDMPYDPAEGISIGLCDSRIPYTWNLEQ